MSKLGIVWVVAFLFASNFSYAGEDSSVSVHSRSGQNKITIQGKVAQTLYNSLKHAGVQEQGSLDSGGKTVIGRNLGCAHVLEYQAGDPNVKPEKLEYYVCTMNLTSQGTLRPTDFNLF